MKEFYVDKETRSMITLDHDPRDLQDEWWITGISVPRPARRRGVATRLLQEVFRDADQEGVVLSLIVGSGEVGAMSNDQLHDWYLRLGFQSDRLARSLMRKIPDVDSARALARARVGGQEIPESPGASRATGGGAPPTR